MSVELVDDEVCSENKNDQLTVVIPTFQNGESLIRAVQSATNADKVIVVLDGKPIEQSVFNSINRWPHVDIVELKKNKGVTHARNVGFLRAQQGLVVFLDADDELLPGAEKRVKHFCHKHANGIGVWLYACELENGKTLPPLTTSGEPEALLSNANRGERTVVVRRPAKVRFLPFIGALRGHERAGLYRYCVRTHTTVLWSEEKVREYNTTEGGLSSQRLSRDRAKLIGTGHLVVSKLTFERGKYKLGWIYLLKALKYLIVSSFLNLKSPKR